MPKQLTFRTTVSGESVAITATKTVADNAIARKGIPNDEFPFNEEVEMVINAPISRVKAFVVTTDVDITIRTNEDHDGSPDDVVAVPAGLGLIWYEGMGTPLSGIFTADITKLYITNESEEEANGTVEVVVLSDSTIND